MYKYFLKCCLIKYFSPHMQYDLEYLDASFNELLTLEGMRVSIHSILYTVFNMK